jgi:hypothetical protein
MLFLSSLVLAGAIVYTVNPDGGALMIAAGCAAAVVKWLAPVIASIRLKA